MEGWREVLEDILLILGALIAAGSLFSGGMWLSNNWTKERTTLEGALEAAERDIVRLRAKIAELEQTLSDRDRKIAEIEGEIPAPIAIPGPMGAPPGDIDPMWVLRAVSEADLQLLEQKAPVPVLVIANLKGGVAKTTVSANLGAYFCKRGSYLATNEYKNKRVLLIDLDYQGSLSDMVLGAMNPAPPGPFPTSLVERLYERAGILPGGAVSPAGNLPGLSLMRSEYGFDVFEARKLMEWLVGHGAGDIRFTLTQLLRDPALADHYDLIIIDTGPRLTLGSVSALAAATHLLIPSAPDRRSGEAAQRFIRRISVFREQNITRAKLIGVLPTLVSANNQPLVASLRAGIDELLALPQFEWAAGAGLLDHQLPISAPIQKAGETTLAYLASAAIRSIFNGIGAEVESRLA